MDKWMSNNNFNKILALAIAIILWTIVHIDSSAPNIPTSANMKVKTIENVKIDISGFDEDKYVLDYIDPEIVSMEVRGRSTDPLFVYSDAYKVTLDLSDVQPGVVKIPLTPSLPNGVDLISMTPQEVSVHIELRNTKSFPVTVVTKGEPAPGYQLGTPIVEPVGTAAVTLAASELSRVSKVQGTIELDGESETVKAKKIKLIAYDKEGKEIKEAVIEPSTVSVELPITLPFKSVPLDIGFTGQLPSTLVLSRVTPEFDKVVVYGNKEALLAINSYEATIDLSTIDSAGTKQVKIELTPPEGLEKMEPGSVNVTVSATEVAERTIDGIPVVLRGMGGGLVATVTEPANETVSLTLSGAPALLDQLNQNNISVVADVTGLSTGAHEVSLRVTLPDYVTLNSSMESLVATVQLQSKATPTVTPIPESTPEPNSEPVSGEGATSATQATPEGSEQAIPNPTPSPSNGDNANAGVNESTGNASNRGGT